VPRSDLVSGNFAASGIGIQTMKQYWQMLGFGEKTGIDLPFERESFLPDPANKEERTGISWRLGDTYNISIGQGDLMVTPLQLLNFIASVGNGGKIYQPFLAKGALPEVMHDYSEWSRELEVVQRGLQEAVSSPLGSSFFLRDLPMTVAGKTGTPQIANKQFVNAFFAGYAPAEKPEIALIVGIERAREGSLNALPIVKDAFRWYYEHRIAPEKEIEK